MKNLDEELSIQSDEHFMRMALQEAQRAMEKDEVPVGAIVISRGKIIARGHNLTETLNDVTAHAEMQAITSAANHLGGKYLDKCTLYVTLEPCPMCAGALFWSHIGKIVYGAADDKRGYSRLSPPLLHPKTEIKGGVLAEEASALLKTFFKSKRK
jgi:tRNA(adenine34) deaminase